ncbi:MAG TPA: ABC transporter ATP-binding protein [Thermodesulfobacteriota bacterium]|nr:ABC transporter ATP-binding protein [Thermodesulfobacteriota bacterium]
MLKVSELAVSYGDIQVLFNIGLQMSEREFVSVVGANASGKSTLLRSISGLLRKTSGSIQFQGKQLIGKPPYEIVERGIVHIPEGRRVFPLMSVQENLEVGAYARKSRINMNQSLKEVYDFFPQLHEHRNQIAGSLSGGEQQMLAIARGLMARPILLTVDEPSLGLAPLLVGKTFEILQKINRENVTILLVEQNVFNALNLSHRAYVIENGRIVLNGSGADLLKDEHLKKAYLGI